MDDRRSTIDERSRRKRRRRNECQRVGTWNKNKRRKPAVLPRPCLSSATLRLGIMNGDFASREVRADACLSASLARCPFLAEVAKRATPDVAKEMALSMGVAAQCPVDKGRVEDAKRRRGPIFVEDTLGRDVVGTFLASFDAVHGAGGLVDLARARNDRDVRHRGDEMKEHSSQMERSGGNETEERNFGVDPVPLAATALASMSLSGGMGKIPDAIMNAIKNKRQGRKPKPRGSKGSNASSTGNALDTASSPSSSDGSPQPDRFRNIRNCMTHCPPAIVAMRAAVANLKPVRQLRPYALPVRAIALAGVTISLNVPMGMLRSKTRKFSPEWVIVVHAIIPFIAALRKACLMPLWGLGLTVAGSVAGQYFGETLERKRVKGDLKLGESIKQLHPDRLFECLLP